MAIAGRFAAARAKRSPAALNAIDRRAVAGSRPPTVQDASASNGLIANVFAECNTTCQELIVARQKNGKGDISKDDFPQQIAQNGCERVGGLIGGEAFGRIGKLVIPVPFIGGFIGFTLGNLIERWCGAVIGRQLDSVIR